MTTTTNYVNVVGSAVDFGGAAVNGYVKFEIDDLVWDTELNLISGGETDNQMAVFGGGSAQINVELFAMDNQGISTNWHWLMSGQINGFAFPPRLLVVNFANGPQQQLATLLQSSTKA